MTARYLLRTRSPRRCRTRRIRRTGRSAAKSPRTRKPRDDRRRRTTAFGQCTRSAAAPLSAAMRHASAVASSGSIPGKNSRRNLFLDGPMSTLCPPHPNRRALRRISIARPDGVPKPMPGSRKMSSSGIPADTAVSFARSNCPIIISGASAPSYADEGSPSLAMTVSPA